MDVEILELNDDGTFDVPSPTRKPVNLDVELIEPSSEEVERVTAESLGKSTLDIMSTGEYKLYKTASHLSLLVKVDGSEKPESASLDDSNRVHVNTSRKQAYSVQLPAQYQYDKDSLTARFHGDAIIVTVNVY